VLLLDAEALSAVAHGPTDRRRSVHALVADARSRRMVVCTVSAVLAEVVRGRPADAAVFAAIRRHRVEVRAVDTGVAVRAGALLELCRAGSELAVDAFVAAVADLSGGAVVATADPSDLRRLAAHCSTAIRIVPI